jgi:hypothetical protein
MPKPLLEVHPNRPETIQFPCPSCGRECLLTPKFYEQGAAKGVRHGHTVQHSIPPCRVYETMTPRDFLVLATAEIPILNQDLHVSVKMPDAPPLIISDLGKLSPEEAEQRAAEGQEAYERDRAAFRADAADLGRVRDHLVEQEQRELELEGRRAARRLAWTLVLCMAVLAVLLGVIVWSLKQHG